MSCCLVYANIPPSAHARCFQTGDSGAHMVASWHTNRAPTLRERRGSLKMLVRKLVGKKVALSCML